MAYAKTSERAERRALRERMRAQGLTHRQIAFEFGRRYDMRPRAAWRHARGWSLQQAAGQITSYAARSGSSTAVVMTGPHLCETEAWPGYGAKPSGRRPTPYLLSLLAAVYGCGPADLLDHADYEHMNPADLLVISKTAAAGGPESDSGRPGQQPLIHPAARIAYTPPPLASARHLGPDPAADLPVRAAAITYSPGLAPLAGALTSAQPPGDAPITDLAGQAAEMWRLRQAARYRQLAAELPAILTLARGCEMSRPQDRRVAAVLTHLYNVASSLAKTSGSPELAGIAADRAMRAAGSTGDPLLSGAAAYRLANVLLSAGHLESARTLAVTAADQLCPVLNATRSHTAMWGALLATAALAAAQAGDAAQARELLGASKVAADLLGTAEQADLYSIFGPANWLIHAVNVAADIGDGTGAVTRAAQIPAGKLPAHLAERRTFLLLGKARGHALCGDQESAALALLDAEHAAPEEVRRNPGARGLAASLLRATPVPGEALLALAARMSYPGEQGAS